MQFVYEEQLRRMECMAQEAVLFEDILCQMIDMIGPEVQTICLLMMIVWFIIFLCLNVSCFPSTERELCNAARPKGIQALRKRLQHPV